MPDPRARDPRFPDRPTHRDFIRLSEIVQAHDDRAEIRGENPFAIAGVDEESIRYFIENRLGVMQQALDIRLPMKTALMALYLDAFALGQRFTQERVEDALEHYLTGRANMVERGFPLIGNEHEQLAKRVRQAMREGTYPPEDQSRKGDADE